MTNRRGKIGSSAGFIFLGSKITAYGDFSHEIKRYLHFGRKAMTNLDSVLRSRDITLPTKVHILKAIVFLVVMSGCESWTIKKAGHQRTDAFKWWCWRRLLRVPWTARSNLSILKEINPEYSLEGLMMKLNLQYFGHLMWRANSLEKTICWEEWKWKVKLISLVWLFATPWTVACQAPLSMGFSRQEYWSGFPFLSSLLGKTGRQ